MKKLNKQEIRYLMKHIVWYYHQDPYELYELVTGKKPGGAPLDAEKIFIRMIERLSWYDCLNLLGLDYLRENLTETVIKKIRFKEKREKYEFARKILQGEAVSFTGWSDEYRQKIKHSLLSDRWYRAEQALL